MSDLRTMDKAWIEIQRKTFTKWCNNHLCKKFGASAAISNIENDFENGIKLMELVNALYGTSMPKHNKVPKMRPHILDNCQLALAMLDQAGVKTNFLKTFHLADKDLKMLLGMIWAIILDYQIKGISVEEVSAKEGLLLWAKRKTNGYKDVNIENFTTSWQNGLGFCALIHRHRPDLLDYSQLSKENPRENLELAFDVAEKQLGIPRLLDVEDIVDVARPDERSVITYVSEYFHCFSAQDQVEVAGRRLMKWVGLAKSNEQLKNDYLNKAKELINWIESTDSSLQDRNYDGTLQGIESKWEEFKDYKKSVKPPKTNDKLDVEATFNNLQAVLRVNNRPAFVPPEDLSLATIDRIWNHLGEEENKRAEWLRKELERQKKLEILASRFWRKAKALLTWVADNSGILSSSDFGNSFAEVEAKLKNHEAWESTYADTQKRLDGTKSIGHDLINQGYGRADEVTAKIQELDNNWASLKETSDARRAALEQELERQRALEGKRLEFATRSRAIVTWIEDAEDGEIAEPVHADSLETIEQMQASLSAFLEENNNQSAEYNNLVQFSQEMANDGITYNPYATFTVDQVTERWNRLQGEIAERDQALQSERARIQENDNLCKEFAQLAKQFSEWAESKKDSLAKIEGTLEEQANTLRNISSEVQSNRSQVDELVQFNNQIEERNVTHNPYTEQTIESISLAFDNLVDTVSKQINLVETEILNQSGSRVSEEQLAEFKETFKNFDKDGSGTLEKHEFEACLKALGQSLTPDQLDNLFTSIGKTSPGKVVFQEFVDYMVSKTEDTDSPSTIKSAFKTIAHERDYVTEEDLRRVPGLTEETIQFLLVTMPKEGNSFNYGAFTDKQYRN